MKRGKNLRINAAFTLVEVLIVVGVIGVVAAMTLPTLMHDILERENAAKVAVFNAKFIQGLNLAKNAGDMGNQFNSTYDFLKNGLSKHIRMSTICDSSNLEKCLGYDKIKYEKDVGKEKEVSVSTLTAPKDLGIKDKNFKDVAAFTMADGTPVILTYNTNCTPDNGINNTISLCVAGLFDINGSKAPNMFLNKVENGKSKAKDIRSFNGAYLGMCSGRIGELCILNSAAGGSPTSYDEMYEAIKDFDSTYERPYDNGAVDNWSMAKVYCEKVMGGELPTTEQLNQIGTALYGEEINDNYNGAIKNQKEVFTALGLDPSLAIGDLGIWTSSGCNKCAYLRSYRPSGTYYYRTARWANANVICVQN